jgi:thiamine biosynthesis lipoprotein
MMNRRRFLTITACAFATPLQARTTWSSRALGADASITLAGPAPKAQALWRRVQATLDRVEAHFSLHRDSCLTRLNRDGHLAYPDPDILELVALADRVHRATAGAFDPSVQPLWLATAAGTDPALARTGWQRLRASAREIRLEPGMALTFNGIAQGFAADKIADLLRAEGYDDLLIDMGEIRGLGPFPWQATIADPAGIILGQIGLQNRALATSSPRGTVIGADQSHILHPSREAKWGTAAISAPSAALADALSTACCLMRRDEIDEALASFFGVKLETLS